MDIIEQIKKNVSNVSEIVKIAKDANVDYTIAHIMYNGGKFMISKDDAEEIYKIAVAYNIPGSLIIDYAYDDNGMFKNDSNLLGLYNHIADIACDGHFEEVIPNINLKTNYGEALFLLIGKGFTLDAAKRIFDMRVKLNMRLYNISKEEAMLFLLTDLSVDVAKVCCESQRDDIDSFFQLVRSNVIESTKFKQSEYEGIKLISKTDDGLRKLEEIVQQAFIRGDSEFLDNLISASKDHEFFISDFNLIKSASAAFYVPYLKCVCLDTRNKNMNHLVSTLFHEVTHFLDNSMTDDTVHLSSYVDLNSELIELLKKINEKFCAPLRSVEYYYFKNIMSKKYAKDLSEKWRIEIEQNHPDYDSRIIDKLLEEKMFYEREKFAYCYYAFCDIFDALENGALREFGLPGHGKKYYSLPGAIEAEVLANIGHIINIGGLDLLIHEFGEDIACHMYRVYNTLILFTADSPPIKAEIVDQPELEDDPLYHSK